MSEVEQPDQHLDDTLRRGRPRPRRAFGAGLRQRLVELDARARRPARLREMVIAYIGAGGLLLLLAALGAGGGGLFGS